MVDSQPFLSYPSPVDPTTLPISYGQTNRRRRPIKGLVAVAFGLLMVALLAAIICGKDPRGLFNRGQYEDQNDVGFLSKSGETAPPETFRPASSRGVSAGVSEKTNKRLFSGENSPAFPWNNSMLSWQRTAFHFQPEKNWMNGTFSSFKKKLFFIDFLSPDKLIGMVLTRDNMRKVIICFIIIFYPIMVVESVSTFWKIRKQIRHAFLTC